MLLFRMSEGSSNGTKMDEWTPKVVYNLGKFFEEENVKRFRNLLKETEALVAGGFILQSCIGGSIERRDIDIYVPVKNIPKFMHGMFQNETSLMRLASSTSYSASLYCHSFLRKNGIRKVYSVASVNKRAMDIMSVRNKRTPLAVVNNFDLTFCQVWYDGESVFASHPDDIKSKNGKLRKEYCKTLLEGNRFLKRRVQKYIKSGFKIGFEEGCVTNKSILNDIFSQIVPKEACTGHRATNEPSYFKHWFQRIAIKWFNGYRDYNLNRDNGAIDPNDKENDVLIIPLFAGECRKDMDLVCTDSGWMDLKPYGSEEGYDSDEYNDETGTELAVKNFASTGLELSDEANLRKMKYLRALTSLFINTNTRLKGLAALRGGESHGVSMYSIIKKFGGSINDTPEPSTEYHGKTIIALFKKLKQICLPEGQDQFGETGRLYHIHNHPIEWGITQESLESYIESVMLAESLDHLPCYYKPEPVVAGAPPNPKNCNQFLTLRLLQPIVSTDFYKRLTTPRPKKDGLDQEIINFDLVFRNSKSPDPHWGNIYHVTMCPFCLLFVERGEGCAYMVHDNPDKLSQEHAPFCKSNRVVEPIRQSYAKSSAKLDPGYMHLEFCVECGRPCSGHKHFNLDGTALINNNRIADPLHPDRVMIDYGNCPGGGRVEMVARMLAVIDTYKVKRLRDTAQERATAAFAANEAPGNKKYMDRARKIMEKAPADRKWNVYVPKSKRYNDPLYEDVEDNSAWNTVMPANAIVPAPNPDAAANAANAANILVAPPEEPPQAGGIRRRKSRKIKNISKRMTRSKKN